MAEYGPVVMICWLVQQCTSAGGKRGEEKKVEESAVDEVGGRVLVVVTCYN